MVSLKASLRSRSIFGIDLQYALKNMIEKGTNIEYFDNRNVIQINKDIKVFEKGKRKLKKLTQAQQNKLLLQARGGGKESKKNNDDSISEVREKPLKKQISNRVAAEGRNRVVKSSKTPQINYTNPQLDLKELI
ncbi:MAG: hypothetical protein EZS28_046914, partial [Streblomastix strix]